MPLHLQLHVLVKWEVVSPNSRYRAFYHEIWNIEKFPFTYWLNKWEVVSPNRRYTCREFLHEVNWKVVSPDSTVGIYVQYIYNKNCGVSFWTCSREISGDRVALFWNKFKKNEDCILISLYYFDDHLSAHSLLAQLSCGVILKNCAYLY